MKVEKGKPLPGPSAYEFRFTEKADENREEWNLIMELDPTTGRVLQGPHWHRPFGRRLPP